MTKAENIVLTGFMGTGKTTVGRALSKLTGLRFIDADELIENKAAMPVKDIFALKGEQHFRRLEKEVIKEVTETMAGIIFSVGGGAVIDPENRERLKSFGTVICLTAEPAVIVKRVGEGDERPLLSVISSPHRGEGSGVPVRSMGRGNSTDKRMAKISKLLKQREDAYKDCHFMVDTTRKGVKTVVREIEGFIKGRTG